MDEDADVNRESSGFALRGQARTSVGFRSKQDQAFPFEPISPANIPCSPALYAGRLRPPEPAHPSGSVATGDGYPSNGIAQENCEVAGPSFSSRGADFSCASSRLIKVREGAFFYFIYQRPLWQALYSCTLLIKIPKMPTIVPGILPACEVTTNIL